LNFFPLCQRVGPGNHRQKYGPIDQNMKFGPICKSQKEATTSSQCGMPRSKPGYAAHAAYAATPLAITDAASFGGRSALSAPMSQLLRGAGSGIRNGR
jgi:hypothetical protein